MSAYDDINRIKTAKEKLAAKLTAMGLDGVGLVDALIDEVDGITVHDYSGYADDDVITEELGTESATYNLDKGYYKNSFMLSHPDNGETGGGECVNIFCYTNGEEFGSIAEGMIGNISMEGYYAINESLEGKNLDEVADLLTIEKIIDYGYLDGNQLHLGWIPNIPAGAYVDIAVSGEDDGKYKKSTQNGCTCQTKTGATYNGRNYNVYRLTNITNGAYIEFSYSSEE